MGGFLIGTDPTLRKTKTPTVDTFAAGVGFTAGSSTTVSLSADPGTEKHLQIFFDGVGQHRSTYSVSGTTVTFDTAIPTGTAEVEATFALTVPSITVPDDSVATAKIADNAVTLAKLAGGTDGNLISFDSSGDPVAIATGNDGQVLHSAGAGAQPAFETLTAGFTLATEQATTSGTSVTFGSIPAGTKMIIIMFEGVSTNSDNPIDITLGDSGGLETSGYISSSANTDATPSYQTSTSEFVIEAGSVMVMSGHCTLTLKDSSNFTWVQSHMVKQSTSAISRGAGEQSLSAELTQVSISGGTFDAGSINIMYQ